MALAACHLRSLVEGAAAGVAGDVAGDAAVAGAGEGRTAGRDAERDAEPSCLAEEVRCTFADGWACTPCHRGGREAAPCLRRGVRRFSNQALIRLRAAACVLSRRGPGGHQGTACRWAQAATLTARAGASGGMARGLGRGTEEAS